MKDGLPTKKPLWVTNQFRPGICPRDQAIEWIKTAKGRLEALSQYKPDILSNVEHERGQRTPTSPKRRHEGLDEGRTENTGTQQCSPLVHVLMAHRLS